METKAHVVRLLKNRIYPTYQFYAYMANSKTTPQEGLRLGALTAMQWLANRLGDAAPASLQNLPSPEDYKTTDNSALPSLFINQGHVINIVSLPESGTWCLQVSEPDLGSDPGNETQRRSAVPGRVIETNIAFRISGKDLECGFQTNISDPEGTEELAEVYRLAIIRQLLRNPAFGFRHIRPIVETCNSTTAASDCKTILSICKDSANQLPIVIFTRDIKNPKPKAPDFSTLMPMPALPKIDSSTFSQNASPEPPDFSIPYDVDAFAKSCGTFCHTFFIMTQEFEKFCTLSHLKINPGDTVIWEPSCFGGQTHVYPLKPSFQRQQETYETIKSYITSYPREKAYSFGHISFLSDTHEWLLRESKEAIARSEKTSEISEQKFVQIQEHWKAEIAEKNRQIEDLTARLTRQRQETGKVEQEKAGLRESHDADLLNLQQIIADRDEEIAYYKRKLTQPKGYADIPEWVERNFTGRILLHKRAIDMLCDRSPKNADVGLICDAIDYLATDYWDFRYGSLSEEDRDSRCSEKYGRPFDLALIGDATIERYPREYKIKYFMSFKNKPMESPMDCHLRVGNDSENLLRIYLLHDNEKKLLVIGSLPNHLPAVKIK